MNQVELLNEGLPYFLGIFEISTPIILSATSKEHFIPKLNS
jgi:hypothetical protein